MTIWSLVLNSFRYYAKNHIGTILGVAVGAMVLVGALLVGESVKGSLRNMAEARLGKVELTLSSNDRLFRAQLADQIQDELDANTAAILQLPGIAKRPSGESRANNVVVLGVDEKFWKLALKQPEFNIPEDGVVLNERLARQLGNLKVGNIINLRVHNPSQLSRDAPMAPIEDSTASLAQMEIIAIVSEKEFGRFSLQASQVPPYNAFVRLGQLQEAIEKTEMANLMLIGDIEKLSNLNIKLIKLFASILSLEVKFHISSQLSNLSKDRVHRLIDFCKMRNCNYYYSPNGSLDYLDTTENKALFREAGIKAMNRNFMKDLISEETAIKAAEGNIASAVDVGYRTGADVVIVGRAISSKPQGENKIQASITLKVISAFRGALIAAKSEFASALEEGSMRAELSAFDQATLKISDFLIDSVRQFWGLESSKLTISRKFSDKRSASDSETKSAPRMSVPDIPSMLGDL